MPESIPSRIYICADCDYRTTERWVLARHLHAVHKYGKRFSRDIASHSEYWLSPRYIAANPFYGDIDSED